TIDEADGRLNLAVARSLTAKRKKLYDHELRFAFLRPGAFIARRREMLSSAREQLHWALSRSTLRIERRIGRAANRLIAASPHGQIDRGRLQLDQLAKRLQRDLQSATDQRARIIATFSDRLLANSYETVLRRGFTITRKMKSGRIVSRPEDVTPG